MKEEINLDIDTVRNALNAYKAVGFEDNPLEKVTICALEELLAYKQTRLTPDEIKFSLESMKLELERRKTKMFEVKVNTETIKHVMDACKTEKTLNQHGVVIYNCLKELLEYRETELTPDKIREMDKLYLEKCQEVNSLVAACEKLEGRKQYESK